MRRHSGLARELARLGRIVRALRIGPLAPGEVPCDLQHAYGHEDTSKPVRSVGRHGKGCPRCRARL